MRVTWAILLAGFLSVFVSCTGDGSSTERIVVLDLATGDERDFADGFDAAFSPGGSRVVVTGVEDRRPFVVVRDAASGDEQARLELEFEGAMNPVTAWVSDTAVAVLHGVPDATYGTNSVLRLWDVDDGSTRDLMSFDGGGCCTNSVLVAPDGVTLAVSTARQLHVVDLGTESRGQLAESAAFALAYAWSPDGRELLVAVPGGADPSPLAIVPVNGSPHIPIFTGSSNPNASFSPDGSTVAFTGEHELVVWARETGDAVGFLRDEWVNPVTPEWSPDGSRVAVALDQGVAVLDPATGAFERYLTHDDLQAWAIDWSPDGRELLLFVRKAHRGD